MLLVSRIHYRVDMSYPHQDNQQPRMSSRVRRRATRSSSQPARRIDPPALGFGLREQRFHLSRPSFSRVTVNDILR